MDKIRRMHSCLLLPVSVLSLLLSLSTLSNCQSDTDTYFSAGINLPTFIGKSLEVRSVYANHRFYNWTFCPGIMFANRDATTVGKDYPGTSVVYNTGIYLGLGGRFTPRKSLQSSYPFFGVKLIPGYFKQWSTYSPSAQFQNDFYFIGNKVYAEAVSVLMAEELGYAFLVKRKINIEIGLEYGQKLFTSNTAFPPQNSRLPGMGFFHLKGIVAVYYRFM